jgi:hypothetical protein
VEEEPEHGRPGDGGLRHGLLHGATDDGLQIGAGAGVVVHPQLSHGRRRHQSGDEDKEREEEQSKVHHRSMILSVVLLRASSESARAWPAAGCI